MGSSSLQNSYSSKSTALDKSSQSKHRQANSTIKYVARNISAVIVDPHTLLPTAMPCSLNFPVVEQNSHSFKFSSPRTYNNNGNSELAHHKRRSPRPRIPSQLRHLLPPSHRSFSVGFRSADALQSNKAIIKRRRLGRRFEGSVRKRAVWRGRAGEG